MTPRGRRTERAGIAGRAAGVPPARPGSIGAAVEAGDLPVGAAAGRRGGGTGPAE